LGILERSASLFETIEEDGLRASLHNEFAKVLDDLGKTKRRADYMERALSEYAAASTHFEKAGRAQELACAEINQAELCVKTNRIRKAHEHLDRAESLLVSPADDVQLGQLRSIRSQVLIAEGDFANAENMAAWAVQILEKECAPLLSGESLTRVETSLSRFHEPQAREVFETATNVIPPTDAQDQVDLDGLLMRQGLCRGEIREFLEIDFDRLKNSSASDSSEPDMQWARHFLGIHGFGEPDFNNFSFDQTMHLYEAHCVRRALEDANGLISQAAYFLGLRRHQLRYMLKKHHRSLIDLVTAEDQEGVDHDLYQSPNAASSEEDEAIRVLYVGKDLKVTAILQEMAQRDGWKLKRSGNGKRALEKLIVRDGKYDLLLLDYE